MKTFTFLTVLRFFGYRVNSCVARGGGYVFEYEPSHFAEINVPLYTTYTQIGNRSYCALCVMREESPDTPASCEAEQGSG